MTHKRSSSAAKPETLRHNLIFTKKENNNKQTKSLRIRDKELTFKSYLKAEVSKIIFLAQFRGKANATFSNSETKILNVMIMIMYFDLYVSIIYSAFSLAL